MERISFHFNQCSISPTGSKIFQISHYGLWFPHPRAGVPIEPTDENERFPSLLASIWRRKSSEGSAVISDKAWLFLLEKLIAMAREPEAWKIQKPPKDFKGQAPHLLLGAPSYQFHINQGWPSAPVTTWIFYTIASLTASLVFIHSWDDTRDCSSLWFPTIIFSACVSWCFMSAQRTLYSRFAFHISVRGRRADCNATAFSLVKIKQVIFSAVWMASLKSWVVENFKMYWGNFSLVLAKNNSKQLPPTPGKKFQNPNQSFLFLLLRMKCMCGNYRNP